MASDYLPKSVYKFILFAKTFFLYVTANFERLQAPDPAPYLKAALDDLEAKHDITLIPNAGKVDVVKRNAAWSVAEKACRVYIQGFIARNPNVTDADRIEMGLPVRDYTPTAHQRPTAVPDVAVETTAYHYQHRVRITNAENGKTTKPAGVHGVRIVWQAGNDRPVTPSTMPNSQFGRRTETIIIHNEINRGRIAYYAACYENARGEAGPWSPIVEAYIG